MRLGGKSGSSCDILPRRLLNFIDIGELTLGQLTLADVDIGDFDMELKKRSKLPNL